MTTDMITAHDGHQFACYRAEPAEKPKAAVLVIQEIFGVNGHIRGVADRYAEHGYLAYAPHLFDRTERGVELGYTPEFFQRGIDLAYGLEWDTVLADIAATCRTARAKLGHGGKVFLVGYCWGGSLAWLAATRLSPPDGPDACSSYYGSSAAKFLDERPTVPVEMHLGETDKSIPPETIEAIKAAQPEIPVFVYPGADHGFNCDQRPMYDAAAAKLAEERTLTLFQKVLDQR